MKKYIIIGLIFIGAIAFFNHKVIAQSFQMLYVKQIQFEYNGVGLTLQPGNPIKAGAQVITLPDGTGTIDTSYNNFNFLLTALKAIDAGKGNHSGINWTSLGV